MVCTGILDASSPSLHARRESSQFQRVYPTLLSLAEASSISAAGCGYSSTISLQFVLILCRLLNEGKIRRILFRGQDIDDVELPKVITTAVDARSDVRRLYRSSGRSSCCFG